VLDVRSDLVVAAGGDGTVAAAARVLAGSGIPLAILPLGTANNIARSIGATATPEELIRRWELAERRPLDLGIARGAWGERPFVESVGGGLVAAGIARMKAVPEGEEEPPRARIARAVAKYREVLSELRPRPWTLSIDGQLTAGEFLLVEVLNIPSIGPNLILSGDADPFDGSFTVLMVSEEHRHTLDGYLRQRLEGGGCLLSIETQRASEVEIHGSHDIHVDDTLIRAPSVGVVSVRIDPGAVHLLQ
jgi:diacylglycerol kinase family enzyme